MSTSNPFNGYFCCSNAMQNYNVYVDGDQRATSSLHERSSMKRSEHEPNICIAQGKKTYFMIGTITKYI